MDLVEKLFKCRDGRDMQFLKRRAAQLKKRGYIVNYHIRDAAAVVLVNSVDKKLMPEGVIFEYPGFALKARLYRVEHGVPREAAKCYELIDGTVLYMYHFAGSWNLASWCSVRVNETVLRQVDTFENLFNEALEGLDLQLDTSKWYSFGFANPRVHYGSRERRVWSNDFDGRSSIPTPREIKPEEADLGTLQDAVAAAARHITYTQKYKDLRNIFYVRRVMRHVRENEFDYIKFVTVRAWAISDYMFERFLQFAPEVVRPWLEQLAVLEEKMRLGREPLMNALVEQYGSVSDKLKIESIRTEANVDWIYSIIV